MVDTITREQYTSKLRNEYAGPVQSLILPETAAGWAQHAPDWDGKYWHMAMGDRGTYLGPVNVAPTPAGDYRPDVMVRFRKDVPDHARGLTGYRESGRILSTDGRQVHIRFRGHTVVTSVSLLELV